MAEERIDIIRTKSFGNVLRHVERYVWAARFARGRTIDVACGTGYGTALLAGSPKVKTVLGLDSSESAITICRNRYGHSPKKLSFRCGDVMTVTGAQTYVSFETVEHIPEPERFLNRLHHLLPEDGQLLMSVPLDEEPGHNEFHLHTFSAASIKGLLGRCGFLITDAWVQDDGKNRYLVLRTIPRKGL